MLIAPTAKALSLSCSLSLPLSLSLSPCCSLRPARKEKKKRKEEYLLVFNVLLALELPLPVLPHVLKSQCPGMPTRHAPLAAAFCEFLRFLISGFEFLVSKFWF